MAKNLMEQHRMVQKFHQPKTLYFTCHQRRQEIYAVYLFWQGLIEQELDEKITPVHRLGLGRMLHPVTNMKEVSVKQIL